MKENLKYSEILRANQVLARESLGEVCEIAVVSNITIAQLKEICEYTLRIADVNARVSVGGYDNIVQDSFRQKHARVVTVFWEAANVIDGFQYKSNLMSDKELDDMIQKTKGEIDLVLNNLRSNSLVIFNKFSSLAFNSSYLEANNLDKFCDALNSHLEAIRQSNVVLIDIDKVFARVSVAKSINLRYFYSSKALYSVDFFREYALHVRPILLSAFGKAKKALIFDCDNTLWKGILGEDGVNGIAMSAEVPDGGIFEEVQAIACDLSRKGVLLGLCSKNNPSDLEEVLSSRHDMQLGEGELVTKKVNWNDKVVNLREISRDLNIGFDSIVFVDDSPFEVDFVRGNLPAVTTLLVPERLYEYSTMMREQSSLFFNISKSREDLSKGEQYRQQAVRESEKVKFGSLDEYLSSLELVATLHCDNERTVARMAQLTQKTNQFNLTTIRYTESDIESLMIAKESSVIALELSDKFGDYGLVGEAILRFDFANGIAHIDTFLMSCRALGRKVENIFMDYLMNSIGAWNIETVRSRYVKTAKNEQVCDFYDSRGFVVTKHIEEEKLYRLARSEYRSADINYIKVVHGK